MSDNDNKDHWKNFTEEMEVAGSQLVDQVSKLIAEGNVRKLRIRSHDDDLVLEVPLTAGAAVGGVVVLAAPWLAILGALAGVLARVRIEVVRDVDGAGPEGEVDDDDGGDAGDGE